MLGPAQPGAGIADSGAALVYLLAQDEGLADELGSPWTGIAVEEIDQGVFLNDLVRLSLVSVSGPGVFSLRMHLVETVSLSRVRLVLKLPIN